jgi:hypothetical protein
MDGGNRIALDILCFCDTIFLRWPRRKWICMNCAIQRGQSNEIGRTAGQSRKRKKRGHFVSQVGDRWSRSLFVGVTR